MVMLVFLLFIPDMAAARPRPLQSGPLDIHARARADAALLVPGDRVPQRHTDLLEREACLYGPADRAHAQVLLLGGEPTQQKRHHAKGTGCV